MKYFVGSALLVDTGQECATLSPHVYGTFWGGIMILKQHAVLAGLVIALVSLSACRSAQVQGPPAPPGQGYGKRDQRVFWIYIYTDLSHPDQCFVDWPVATLRKNAHQTVKWLSDDGGEYTVDFNLGHNQSPFSQLTFHVKNNGETPSGDLTALAQSGKYYDYGIKAGDATGKICKPSTDPDPGLYVK